MQPTREQDKAEFLRRRKKFKEYLRSPDYVKRLQQRLEINDAGERNMKARAYIWSLCERRDNPAEGLLFFLNNFGFTFDPRPEHEPYHLPLITFPYQDQLCHWIIDHIDNGRDGLVEKSRDMGASWLIFVWVPLWYWLFRDGVNFLVGSYKEMLVDDRSQDSIMGKMDYSIDSIPPWLLPRGFKKNKHRTKLKLINPANGNQITGDTMNPDFGRGSRKTAVLFDELGSWDYAKDAWESSGDSTSCRIANSTPKGYNYYAMLRESGIDVITLHWRDHPLKDQDWYEYETQRRTDEEVAQELDISYTKSREGQVYPEWNEVNVVNGYYPYDPNLPLYTGIDFGKTDDTAIIWAQPDPQTNMLKIIDAYRNNGKNIDFYVPFFTGIIPGNGYEYNSEDRQIIEEHKEWGRATHFGDPAGRFRNQIVDDTVISVLKNYGIVVNFKERWKSFQIRKSTTKKLIEGGVFLNDNSRTRYFSLCMINSSYPKVRREGQQEVRSDNPRHDAYSHYRTAFEYLALGLTDIQPIRRRPVDKFPKRQEKVGTLSQRKRSVGY